MPPEVQFGLEAQFHERFSQRVEAVRLEFEVLVVGELAERALPNSWRRCETYDWTTLSAGDGGRSRAETTTPSAYTLIQQSIGQALAEHGN